jgi:hypothetical protein
MLSNENVFMLCFMCSHLGAEQGDITMTWICYNVSAGHQMQYQSEFKKK